MAMAAIGPDAGRLFYIFHGSISMGFAVDTGAQISVILVPLE